MAKNKELGFNDTMTGCRLQEFRAYVVALTFGRSFAGTSEISGRRAGGRFLPAPPVVAEALRLRAPAAQGVLLEAVGVLEAEPVALLPVQHSSRCRLITSCSCTITTSRRSSQGSCHHRTTLKETAILDDRGQRTDGDPSISQAPTLPSGFIRAASLAAGCSGAPQAHTRRAFTHNSNGNCFETSPIQRYKQIWRRTDDSHRTPITLLWHSVLSTEQAQHLCQTLPYFLLHTNIQIPSLSLLSTLLDVASSFGQLPKWHALNF